MGGWLDRFLRRWKKGSPPTLVRLRTRSGEFVEGPVTLHARLPDGALRTWTSHAAQGLCMVHLRVRHRVDLEIRTRARDGGELRGAALLSREDVEVGRAAVVWLEEATPPRSIGG